MERGQMNGVVDETSPKKRMSRRHSYIQGRTKSQQSALPRTNLFCKETGQAELKKLAENGNCKKTTKTIRTILATLKKHVLFRSIQEFLLISMINVMKSRPMKEGDILIQRGDLASDEFFFLETGEVRIQHSDFVEDDLLIPAPHAFGETGLINSDLPRTATVTCTKSGNLWVITRSAFRATMHKTSASREIEVLGFLKEVPLLSNLSHIQLVALASAFQEKTYKGGTAVFRQEDVGDSLYIILKGSCLVSQESTRVVSDNESTKDISKETQATKHVSNMSEMLQNFYNSSKEPGSTATRKVANFLTRRTRAKVSPEKSDASPCIEKEESYARRSRRKSTVNVATLKRGDYFGEIALLPNAEGEFPKRLCTVTAITDTAICLRLTAADFDKLIPKETLSAFVKINAKRRIKEIAEKQAAHAEARKEKNEVLMKDTHQNDKDKVEKSMKDKEVLRISLDDFKCTAVLGAGTFGNVFLALHKDTKEEVAIKSVGKAHLLKLKQETNIVRERKAMAHFRDETFIVNLVGTWQDERSIYFITDMLVSALETVHTAGFAHRDIKLENILLCGDGYIKLADFGFAKRLGPAEKTKTLVGTPEYLAPEMVKALGHNRSVDYWALGIIVYELLHAKTPFVAHDQMRLFSNIVHSDKSLYFEQSFQGKPAEDLVRKLLTDNACLRLGMLRGGVEDVKSHVFFEGVDFEKLRNKIYSISFIAAPKMVKRIRMVKNGDYNPLITGEFTAKKKGKIVKHKAFACF
eukprot:g653.t1